LSETRAACRELSAAIGGILYGRAHAPRLNRARLVLQLLAEVIDGLSQPIFLFYPGKRAPHERATMSAPEPAKSLHWCRSAALQKHGGLTVIATGASIAIGRGGLTRICGDASGGMPSLRHPATMRTTASSYAGNRGWPAPERP
jgi:hypothetical protein